MEVVKLCLVVSLKIMLGRYSYVPRPNNYWIDISYVEAPHMPLLRF